MVKEFKMDKINGRETMFYLDYYIRVSCCDNSQNWYHSFSISIGKWHYNKKGKIVLEKAIKRIKYLHGGKDKAINKALEYIGKIKKGEV
jgi:hypothetical protein